MGFAELSLEMKRLGLISEADDAAEEARA